MRKYLLLLKFQTPSGPMRDWELFDTPTDAETRRKVLLAETEGTQVDASYTDDDEREAVK